MYDVSAGGREGVGAGGETNMNVYGLMGDLRRAPTTLDQAVAQLIWFANNRIPVWAGDECVFCGKRSTLRDLIRTKYRGGHHQGCWYAQLQVRVRRLDSFLGN